MSVCISPPCQSVPVAFNSCQLHSSCAIFTHLLHFPAPQPPYLAPKYFECRRTLSFGKERTRRFCSLVQRGGGGKLPSYLRTNHPSRSTSAPPSSSNSFFLCQTRAIWEKAGFGFSLYSKRMQNQTRNINLETRQISQNVQQQVGHACQISIKDEQKKSRNSRASWESITKLVSFSVFSCRTIINSPRREGKE